MVRAGAAFRVQEPQKFRMGAMSFARLFPFTAALTAALVGAISTAAPSFAADCPGNPDAIGTSRVIEIDPAEYPRVGSLNYSQSLPLPLEDHEVVLTFDDGPLPPHTTRVLDVLAAQCVKANFFLVGEMARNFPAVVKRIYQDGHAIGTHSEDHPLRFGQMPIEKIRWEIDRGIADVSAAVGDPMKVAPFFRFPGFARSDIAEAELADRKLAVFSTDTVEDDWHRHISPKQIISLALSRLEKRGRGILLLHDIHPWTATALPDLLKQLKDRGFHLVQVVPTPASVAAAVAAASETTVAWTAAQQDFIDNAGDAPIWPVLTPLVTPETVAFDAPDAKAFDTNYQSESMTFGKVQTAAMSSEETPVPVHTKLWPDPQENAALANDNSQLLTPDVADIGWPLHLQPHAIETPAIVLQSRANAAASHGRHRFVRDIKHTQPKGGEPKVSAHTVAHHPARAPAGAAKRASLGDRLAALLTPAK
jgi:peptidoglycan/xylan/chitin deacetylase (PgdA/CDA1 family)